MLVVTIELWNGWLHEIGIGVFRHDQSEEMSRKREETKKTVKKQGITVF
jgi:hypothetical protein